jgi:hypothetical protein
VGGAERVDVEGVLAGLKPFQRRSVDYVFERLYGPDPTRRFLLADEVGLGKTHVARGVVAKAIEHLRAEGIERIDVVYICSNADIARQNISRLNVTRQDDFRLASRITLLPRTVRKLRANPLNFVSFTPGTSFDMGKRTGTAEERWLLYWLLRWKWPKLVRGTAPKNVMQGSMGRERFREWIRERDPRELIDRELAGKFRQAVRRHDRKAREKGEPTYRARFKDLCGRFARHRKHVPWNDRMDRNVFIGEMRALLAATCIEALEPDLVILDEFQRFKNLLRPDNGAGALARHLFDWQDARVLLLSATPYKMLTLAHEADSEDHYRDFVETLSFLLDDGDRTEEARRLLAEYGRMCTHLGANGREALADAKQRVESTLRSVMCRTERLAVTADRSGMLRDVSGEPLAISAGHVRSYLGTQAVARALGHPDVTEYWKASPYLLNFMEADGYKLKGLLRDSADEGVDPEVSEAVKRARGYLLDRRAWSHYRKVDPRHALLERLSRETIGAGWWRLLWVPPSMPYYRLGGPFREVDPATVTKRLVFSSWHVVPRAVSILMSYEAERRMMSAFDSGVRNTAAARERRRPLLVFSRSEGRLTGLPVLALLYPSTGLAALGDPITFWSGSSGADLPGLEHVVRSVAGRIRESLVPALAGAREDGPEDEAWYWAAPILLDRRRDQAATEEWFSDADRLARSWSPGNEEAEGWRDHVRAAAEVAMGHARPEGRPPADLVEVLAFLAVAGPGVASLRSLGRAIGSAETEDVASMRHAAGRVAWGFRTLFNTPEVTSLIRAMNGDEPYWRRVLEYAAEGGIQSVLDEYMHLQVELEGYLGRPSRQRILELADGVASRIGLRAANPGMDWVGVARGGGIRIEPQRTRVRFAMRFGDERGEREEGAVRKDLVRTAFNSPFWPFVLVTTSIGQEGLDFHPYCHAVVHWNPPRNPVDLEQREGRVHRYKGHAVRKNVARIARTDRLALPAGADPWREVFRHAAELDGKDAGIRPYWVFPVEGGAVIERHAPSLPLSREAALLPRLRASLAVYRMVFGQPRQDDLIEHLRSTVPDAELARLAGELSIDLEPPEPPRALERTLT